MSHNLSSFINQPQTQASNSKKRQKKRLRSLATGINAIEVAKKDKDKAKDLSYVEYYTW